MEEKKTNKSNNCIAMLLPYVRSFHGSPSLRVKSHAFKDLLQCFLWPVISLHFSSPSLLCSSNSASFVPFLGPSFFIYTVLPIPFPNITCLQRNSPPYTVSIYICLLSAYTLLSSYQKYMSNKNVFCSSINLLIRVNCY